MYFAPSIEEEVVMVESGIAQSGIFTPDGEIGSGTVEGEGGQPGWGEW